MEEYRDLALVIAWPDQTARGDERWMAFLKWAGIVKNLNFKVGHAAIILVNHRTGLLAYYDFGRYITPRGDGRARSASSDPRLTLSTRAQVDVDGTLTNLPAILSELHQKEDATHGGGRLFFSLADGLSFNKATRFADKLVDQGPIPYGAVAPGNNSCSRFVAQVLLTGWETGNPVKRRVKFPESLKPSPMSNVVNASPGRLVYCYSGGVLKSMRMTRWLSLRFQLDLLLHNLSTRKARDLPCDRKPGSIAEPQRPASIPATAQWLGGIGEGAWYALEPGLEPDVLLVTKYGASGEPDYQVPCHTDAAFKLSLPYQFTYHCHYRQHLIIQNSRYFLLEICEHAKNYPRTA